EDRDAARGDPGRGVRARPDARDDRQLGDRLQRRSPRGHPDPQAPPPPAARPRRGARIVAVRRPRLAAEERRALLLETACHVFSRGSYRGVTTAEIAREAGVTEPVLYRHFASKRELYFACTHQA